MLRLEVEPTHGERRRGRVRQSLFPRPTSSPRKLFNEVFQDVAEPSLNMRQQGEGCIYPRSRPTECEPMLPGPSVSQFICTGIADEIATADAILGNEKMYWYLYPKGPLAPGMLPCICSVSLPTSGRAPRKANVL